MVGREERREEAEEEEGGGYCHKSARSKESKMINSEAAGSQRLRVVSRTTTNTPHHIASLEYGV